MTKKYNKKIFNIMFQITLFIPILLLIKYLLGYKVIVYIEIFIYLIFLTLTLIFKFSKNKSYSLYKSVLINYLIYTIVSIYIISFDYKGVKESTIYTLISLIPAIYYTAFYIYYFKTKQVIITD